MPKYEVGDVLCLDNYYCDMYEKTCSGLLVITNILEMCVSKADGTSVSWTAEYSFRVLTGNIRPISLLTLYIDDHENVSKIGNIHTDKTLNILYGDCNE